MATAHPPARKILQRILFNSPFVLRSVEPPIDDAHNRMVGRMSRLGEQIVITLEGDLHLVIHLMISGRLRWKKPTSDIPKGMGLAAFDFESGVLLFTEASKKNGLRWVWSRGWTPCKR